MNAQETFEAVVAHLRKQKHQSKNGNGTCCYRGPQGSMCAIGALIPDDIYFPSMEGKAVNYFLGRDDRRYVVISDFILDNCAPELGQIKQNILLTQLQSLHDDDNNWTEEGIKDSAIDKFIAEMWTSN